MKVETYECDEVKNEVLQPEVTEEALTLIEKLELTGQKSLTTKTETDVETRVPYRKMNNEETKVFRILCPQKQKAQDYSNSPIPLRVLQIMAHAKSLNFFQAFQIWSADGQIKDPVLVAYETDEIWNSTNKPYILARWADELDSWPLLLEKAVKIWKARVKAALVKIKSQIENDLSACDNLTIENAIERDMPSYHGW